MSVTQADLDALRSEIFRIKSQFESVLRQPATLEKVTDGLKRGKIIAIMPGQRILNFCFAQPISHGLIEAIPHDHVAAAFDQDSGETTFYYRGEREFTSDWRVFLSTNYIG